MTLNDPLSFALTVSQSTSVESSDQAQLIQILDLNELQKALYEVDRKVRPTLQALRETAFDRQIYKSKMP